MSKKKGNQKEHREPPVEKERHICSDHEPSLIFDFRPTEKKPDPTCPICKHDYYLSSYSGNKLPNLKQVKAIESGEQPDPTLVEKKAKPKARLDTPRPVEKPKKEKADEPGEAWCF